MVAVGLTAPQFECNAVFGGRLVRLPWRQVHQGRALILLFTALREEGGPAADLVAVNSAVPGLEAARARVAVVVRNAAEDTLAWANCPRGDGAPGWLSFPLIVDPTGQIGALYGLPDDDGAPLQGEFIIDREGVLRQMSVSAFPLAVRVPDWLRAAQSSRPLARAWPWN